MCRIFGVVYGPNAEDIDNRVIATTLFRRLVGGGPHAYGWMTSDGEGFDIHKFVGRADSLYSAQDVIEFMAPSSRWMVGHTRFATHGAPAILANDHPITHGNIAGVHNGVLGNHESVLKITGREDPKAEVDSEAIFAAVNRWGHKQGLSKIDGNMITVYGDTRKPHLLYFARSYGRELHLAWSDRGNMFFASEEQALRALQPEVNLVRWSTLSAYRHLTVRDGAIIGRQTYDEAAKIKHAKAQKVAPKWQPKANKKAKATATTRMDSYEPLTRELREANEGIARFNSNMEKYREDKKRKRNRRIAEANAEHEANVDAGLAPVMRDPDGKGDLIEWHGMLVTEEELGWLTSE